MSEILKSCQLYPSVKRYGIRCVINPLSSSYPLHRYDYYEFEFIKSGSILHDLNGVREVLHAGDVVTLSPRDLHRFVVLKPVKICNFCINYKEAPNAVENLLSTTKFPLRRSLSVEGHQRALEHHAQLIRTLDQREEFDQERITAHTLLYLAEILSAKKDEAISYTTHDYQYIARTMEFISQNYTSKITLADTANSVHLTPSYFSKLFAQINGKSFIHYLTEQRVEYAKFLLTTTDRSVSDIAFASGLGSFSAFSRAFLSHCGIPPHQFKKDIEKYSRTLEL